MIRYILRKIKNDQSPVFNRWFAYPVVEETVNLSKRPVTRLQPLVRLSRRGGDRQPVKPRQAHGQSQHPLLCRRHQGPAHRHDQLYQGAAPRG